MDDDPEPHPNGTHASSASSPIQPLTPGRSAYQLPALGTFGGVESFHNELFSIPDAEVKRRPNGIDDADANRLDIRAVDKPLPRGRGGPPRPGR